MTRPKKNPLEWVVFAVSALLVLSIAGILVYAALVRDFGPPDLRIELGEPEVRGGVHMVRVHVRNEGGRTAEAVHVEVALRSQGREVERAELVLAFVPARSSREGYVAFRQDPGCCEISARPAAFESP